MRSSDDCRWASLLAGLCNGLLAVLRNGLLIGGAIAAPQPEQQQPEQQPPGQQQPEQQPQQKQPPAQQQPEQQPQQKQPPAQQPQTRPADAKTLLEAFARMPGLEASYREEKHLSLLAVPLKSRGRLYFLRPGYLLRAVEAPEKSTLLITPDELRMAGRDGVEVIDLRQSDRVRLFVTSLTRVFQGDRKALDADYAIDYKPGEHDAKTWSLTLTPRQKPLSEMLRALVLHGSDMAVTGIEVVEPNLDRTVTTIEKADPARTFTKAEKAQLFGLRGDEAGSGDKKAP